MPDQQAVYKGSNMAWDCKAVFVACAFTVETGPVEDVLPLVFTHLSERHYNMSGHSDPAVTLNTGVTYS